MLSFEDVQAREQNLLEVSRQLVRELHPQRAAQVSLLSRLDRDLGIDSLSRAELLLRVERAFRVKLPEHTLTEVDTVGDILTALNTSAPPPPFRAEPATTAPALPLVLAADYARTLTDALDWHATAHPERPHVIFLQDGIDPVPMTYGQLLQTAHKVATGLVSRDISVGDSVALMLPTCLDFFSAFFGILYAGAVPVPIYPPMRMSQLEEHVRRQAGILRNAEARLLITTDQGEKIAALLKLQVPTMIGTETVTGLSSAPEVTLPQTADEHATALLQYTSGSTGDPKGVVLSHANILANIRAIGQAMQAKSSDVFVSWLPLYHDMGLIGAWLGSLYFGAPFYVMSPLTFLSHPESWLWAIHRYRATLSAAPNFAFETCSKIEDKAIEGLDLSSLRLVANGAEPVSANSITRFCERFRAYGFRPEAMAPAYGLAENTVGLTFPPLGQPPVIDLVDRLALSETGFARPAKESDPNPIKIVGCGQPLPGHDVRIVDSNGREVGDRIVGQLEFRGPSATRGYFRNDEKTRELFHDQWLDSGDQAYRAGKDIFITGRIKDIIIRAGRHIFPQEVEEAIGELPTVLRTGVVLFGTADPDSGTEQVVIALETAEQDSDSLEALRQRANEIATSVIGAPADKIVLVPPNSIPKTASGKIRRSAAKTLYEAGQLGAARRSLPWQRFRLILAGLPSGIANWAGTIGEWTYAAWWWLVIAAAATFCWFSIMLLPRLDWRWSTVRWICRAAIAALGIPLQVSNQEGIPSGSAVLVFNHASYADALVLAAILPDSPIFIAKHEFARQIFAGPFLRRLGVAFVERYDVATSLADTEAVAQMARGGRPLVFFPEGTFTRRKGLASFHLGAFKIASEAGLPVFPGAIRGTRDMLRGEQWKPKWSPVSVEIGKPVLPTGTDFSAIVRLRNQTRSFIAKGCQEPDLEEAPSDLHAFV